MALMKYCIWKIKFSSHLESLYFENFSPRLTMVGPTIDTGYERMSTHLMFSIAMLALLPLPYVGMKSHG